MTNHPDPVPATNQAGEVEREAITAAIGKADDAFGYSYRMTSLVDDVATHTLFMDGFEPVSFEDRDDGVRLIAERRNRLRADAVLAALATQPATSQEGEGNRPEIPGSSFAATPTPPTLSDDLREALEPFLHAAEPIIHNDRERWQPDEWTKRWKRVTVGQFRALYVAALARAQVQGS